MGDIYLALDTMNFRNVAVKVLPRLHHSSRVLIARFLREMEVCKRLAHPNVVRLIDAGCDRDTYYMAIEYVLGTGLDDLIAERGQIDVDSALSFTQDIAYALHAAHTQHIIHRDIKPSNVMITRESVIKLIDFGIAQSKDEEVHRKIRDEMDRLSIRFRESELNTSPGAIIGTPCYNSPEQNRGRPVDFSSDIYSLGLVFYEMFTGVQVLPNDQLPVIVDFQARLNDELIPPSQLVPDIPPAIEQIFIKMMQYEPEERFSNAGDLVTALSRATAGSDEEGSSRAKSKSLAQLELSETHYAKAENYLAEGKYLQALGEFQDLLALPIETERYREFIEKWLNFLVSVLKPVRRRRNEEEKAVFSVSPDEYIKILTQTCGIFGTMNKFSHRKLVELRIVENLATSDNYEQVLSTYDELLGAFPDEPILQRGYSRFLFKNGAASAAKRIQYEMITKRLDADQLSEALIELAVILEMDPDSSRAAEEHRVLSAEVANRQAEVEPFLEEMAAMEGQQSPEWLIDMYLKFLQKFPAHPKATEKLHNLYKANNMPGPARDILGEMATEDYFAGRPTAKDKFIKCLHLDKNFTLAHVYLAEIYRKEGTNFSGCTSYSDLVVNIFSMVGMFEQSLEEYEKRLKGSLDDIATFEHMIELLKRLGRREKLFEVYFEMGKCALNNDRIDLAREYFDQCVERSPDQTTIYNKMRDVPNINKVYNLVKLRFNMLTQRGGGDPGAHKDGKRTRGLSTFVAGFRPGGGSTGGREAE